MKGGWCGFVWAALYIPGRQISANHSTHVWVQKALVVMIITASAVRVWFWTVSCPAWFLFLWHCSSSQCHSVIHAVVIMPFVPGIHEHCFSRIIKQQCKCKRAKIILLIKGGFVFGRGGKIYCSLCSWVSSSTFPSLFYGTQPSCCYCWIWSPKLSQIPLKQSNMGGGAQCKQFKN